MMWRTSLKYINRMTSIFNAAWILYNLILIKIYGQIIVCEHSELCLDVEIVMVVLVIVLFLLEIRYKPEEPEG